MPWIYFHEERVELKYGAGNSSRIKESEKKRLEKMLSDFGWKGLRWFPSDKNEFTWNLGGCPPNYKGPYDSRSFHEIAVHVLAVPGKSWKDSGKIFVRDYLECPVFEGPKSVAWGDVPKKEK